AVGGKQGVERAAQLGGLPPVRKREAHPEPRRVNTGVGAPRRRGDCPMAGEALEHPLDLSLNRSAHRLTLPADEIAAVKVEQRQKGAGHRAEIYPCGNPDSSLAKPCGN